MKLALVMIVRDEARCLARCLDSVRPHVDAMIVLDTGSTDATAAIAEAAGARVAHFSWIEDFAAARNAALDLSDADWNLILDADDVLVGAKALQDRALLRGPAFVGAVRIDNSIGVGEQATTSAAWVPRLLPRGVRYAGAIHEQPISDLPRRRVDIAFAHDGYEPAQLARKGDRNEALLLKAIAATPADPYLWYQLGRGYDGEARFDAALIALGEALRLSTGEEPFRHGLVVRALHAMKGAGALEQALALAEAEEARWDRSPDFFFALGDLYLEWAGQDQANALSRWLPRAEASWLRCLQIGERDDLEGGVRGWGGHMAAHNLAALYETFGPADQAAKYQALAAVLKAAA